jgi:hypothetical protein|tara:strand:+ start:413 stop:601 length:189 start_codon:yes stop_codon:yes gene_type:complete
MPHQEAPEDVEVEQEEAQVERVLLIKDLEVQLVYFQALIKPVVGEVLQVVVEHKCLVMPELL